MILQEIFSKLFYISNDIFFYNKNIIIVTRLLNFWENFRSIKKQHSF